MNKITASPETLLHQASGTTAEFLIAATDQLNKLFGPDYARKNPALLGKLTELAAYDFRTSIMASVLQDFSDELKSSAAYIAEAIESVVDITSTANDAS